MRRRALHLSGVMPGGTHTFMLRLALCRVLGARRPRRVRAVAARRRSSWLRSMRRRRRTTLRMTTTTRCVCARLRGGGGGGGSVGFLGNKPACFCVSSTNDDSCVCAQAAPVRAGGSCATCPAQDLCALGPSRCAPSLVTDCTLPARCRAAWWTTMKATLTTMMMAAMRGPSSDDGGHRPLEPLALFRLSVFLFCYPCFPFLPPF